jgi:pimeloyl-ACP methyl ester carboxylesterase
MENLTNDVVELIRAFGEKEACVVGHDWGGAVAWMVALRHPKLVDKLAVLNCPHPIRFAKGLRTARQLRKSAYMFFFQLPWVSEWLLTRNNSELAALMFRRTAIRKGTFSDRDIAEYCKAIRSPGAATGMLNYYRAAFRYRQAITAIQGSVLQVPTCLIWGEEDSALGKELTYGTQALCSGPFELHYFPECGHWVNEEQPERVNELLIRFLT